MLFLVRQTRKGKICYNMCAMEKEEEKEKEEKGEVGTAAAAEAAYAPPGEILGYRFANPGLLAMALTTPAYRMMFPDSPDNQRLEFLGDAVLGLLAADALYRECPRSPEGRLTIQRCHMVSTGALCAAAQRHNLAPLLRRNKGAKELSPNAHTLADAVEAILGAAWLDGGLDAARRVFNALGLEANAESGEWSVNPKGELQKRAQALHPNNHPLYTTLSVTGSSHEPVFTVRVEVHGAGSAEGSARSRKEAEAAAAANLLRKIMES